MIYRIEISSQAKRDVAKIAKWLRKKHAGETGRRWINGMLEAVKTLGTLPKRCSLAPENPLVRSEVRRLLYGSEPNVYRIVFTIEGEIVKITHIRGPGQRSIV